MMRAAHGAGRQAKGCLAGFSEHLVSLLKERSRRLPILPSRHGYLTPQQSLQSVQEHGAVLFVEDIAPDLDHQVGPDTDDVIVEGRVVQLAKGEAIADSRLAERIGIAHDVCGIKELSVPQPAHRALPTVCG
jgi:hypothetical protein